MLKTIKVYLRLPKGQKNYTKYFVENYHLIDRLDIMSPHEVVLTAQYTDKHIYDHGVDLLCALSELQIPKHLVDTINFRTPRTIADSVINIQKHLYGAKQHEFKQIMNILETAF